MSKFCYILKNITCSSSPRICTIKQDVFFLNGIHMSLSIVSWIGNCWMTRKEYNTRPVRAAMPAPLVVLRRRSRGVYTISSGRKETKKPLGEAVMLSEIGRIGHCARHQLVRYGKRALVEQVVRPVPRPRSQAYLNMQ